MVLILGTKGQTAGGGLEAEILNLIPGVKYTFVMYNADTKCRYTQEATMPVNTKSTLVINATSSNTTCAGANDGKVTYTLSGLQAGTTGVSWSIYDKNTNNIVAGGVGNVPAPFTAAHTTPGNLAAGSYYIVFTESPSKLYQCLSLRCEEVGSTVEGTDEGVRQGYL